MAHRGVIHLAALLSLLIVLTACRSIASEPPLAEGARKDRPGAADAPSSPTPAPQIEPAVATPGPRPRWKVRLDELIPKKHMSMQVAHAGTSLYSNSARNRRPPASNEKLLLTMTLFDRLNPNMTITTRAAARRFRRGVVRGNLWIKGRGDPSVSKGGAHAAALPFGATRLMRIVKQLRKAGVKRITGDVIGATGYFRRDWNAPGWLPGFNDIEVGLPTALAVNGNVHKGHFTPKPELFAAKFVRSRLIHSGIAVAGDADMGSAPGHLRVIAKATSRRLWKMTRFMNRVSSNFFAETFGKMLGARVAGPPGSIAKGARVVTRWVKKWGVEPKIYDASGLSYDNRLSPHDLVVLLTVARNRSWGDLLRSSLARGGQGTLENRFKHVRLRAKTGTLEDVSSLSGWVWVEKLDDWAEFSIMSRGIEKSRAVEIENKIVRVLARRAH